MFKLSQTPNKTEYSEQMGKEVLLGKTKVQIVVYSNEGRSGSYERGFKFSTTKYGGLWDKKNSQVSFDHGVTWLKYYGKDIPSQYTLEYVFKATKKGRVKLESDSRGEFAFEEIQKINRQYDPNYKWKP